MSLLDIFELSVVFIHLECVELDKLVLVDRLDDIT